MRAPKERPKILMASSARPALHEAGDDDLAMTHAEGSTGDHDAPRLGRVMTVQSSTRKTSRRSSLRCSAEEVRPTMSEMILPCVTQGPSCQSSMVCRAGSSYGRRFRRSPLL